jgi:hypothetical protein
MAAEIFEVGCTVAVRVTRLGDFSPIGRLFKVDGDFLRKKNSPKKWRFFGRILGLSKIAQNVPYKGYNFGPKKPFFNFFS